MTKFNYVWSYMGRTLSEFGRAISPYITVENGLPYKVYTAKLTQTGTGNPTVTVLQNTLGSDLVWTRSNSGFYTTGTTPIIINSSGTTITCTPGAVGPNSGPIIQPSIAGAGLNSYFQINTYRIVNAALPADDMLRDSFLEIRVYN
jgi:hypothetical protein